MPGPSPWRKAGSTAPSRRSSASSQRSRQSVARPEENRMLPLTGKSTVAIRVRRGARALITIGLIGLSNAPALAADTTIEPMPADLETRYALSALPRALREKATVYLL